METRMVSFGVGVLAVDELVRSLDRRISDQSTDHGTGRGASPARRKTVDKPPDGWSGRPGKRWGVVESGRLEVAMAAYVWGYFLLDTIEVGAEEGPTGPGWSRVGRLASVAEAEALVVHGPVNPDVCDLLAAQLRLVVRVVRDVIDRPVVSESPGRVGAWGAAPQPPIGHDGDR
ncbi:MAG TPA: hypothetical protein VI248_10715 [Kineosporiaceae bacterium]